MSAGALLAAGAAVVLFIAEFIKWVGGGSFWKTTSGLDVVFVLLELVVVAMAAAHAAGIVLPRPFTPARVIVVVGTVLTTLCLIWFAFPGKGFGLWLGSAAAIAILIGGALASEQPAGGLDLSAVASRATAGGAPPAAGPPPGGTITGAGTAAGAVATPPAATPAAADMPTAPAAATPTPDQPISQASPPPPDRPGTPADWYPDPKGEKRLRYWDGSQWTDHVAD